ncbi:MAG: D-2-hydroxyacid dehydrogenase [Firmicutes bacterium]|jgi:glycerate dehydrogenase|nr:D-2-hydroxyacid dehydrogenase [Bacillota bacterium]NBI61798.1 D-2-hydroxyacid dehydrogenase [Clostridiales bacterium]
MKIVILDGHTINPGDLDWNALEAIGDLTVYDATSPEQALERVGDAEILMTSKCPITKAFMEQCPNLKYVGSTATGYNNIDVAAAKELGIAVTYIPAYSTDAVAQHTIALMLELCNNVALHNESVKKGEWTDCKYFCYWKEPIMLLAGRSLGIVGYGQIGQKVGEIAKALGMTINVYSRDRKAAMRSDFLTLHCPLTTENAGFVNREFLNEMKEGSVLINTARGALINEQDLADALRSGHLKAAALDVLAQEPAAADNPLLSLPNCLITPHMAWAPKEMRQIIGQTLADNLNSFLSGGTNNRVDL